ncbi:hypothetical protein NDU88_000907 [Pleurodeles waltl]|uniref:BED-type domain-containing protein n=1 Tax=Pleurodeles waltl TaxID=8319 RepID=A0AAV7Q5E6_PLEWA|nr:hypothetical protein NDU88_000907 [Pleurodeles waltl]
MKSYVVCQVTVLVPEEPVGTPSQPPVPLHPAITFLKGLSDATSTLYADSLPEPPKKKAKLRFVKYRPEWELKHPNIRKSSEDVYKAKCNICYKDFSVAHGGERYIKTHEAVSQHKKNPSSFQPEVAKVTAAEVTQVYHAVKHHISHRSLDCGFKLSKAMYLS